MTLETNKNPGAEAEQVGPLRNIYRKGAAALATFALTAAHVTAGIWIRVRPVIIEARHQCPERQYVVDDRPAESCL